jgi:hypothetical protein
MYRILLWALSKASEEINRKKRSTLKRSINLFGLTASRPVGLEAHPLSPSTEMRVFEALICVMVALFVTAASGELLHSQDGVSQDVHAAHGGEALAAAVQSNLAQGSLVQNSNLHVAQDVLAIAMQSNQARKGLISLRAASRGSTKEFAGCVNDKGCTAGETCGVNDICVCDSGTTGYACNVNTDCCNGYSCDQDTYVCA